LAQAAKTKIAANAASRQLSLFRMIRSFGAVVENANASSSR
jgi:hypothetical protein